MTDDRPPSDEADAAEGPERPAVSRTPDADDPLSAEDPQSADETLSTDETLSADGLDDAPRGDRGDEPGGRDVAVPLRVYKTVTVFSTLFAVVAVVAGFVLLDTATQRATAAPEDVDVAVALLGLGSIALGAVVYAFSTRFRARGMGKPKDEAD